MFTIEAILDDTLRETNVKTRRVISSVIGNRKKLSSIMSFLSETIPLGQFSLSHLKRINSKLSPVQVLIVPVNTEEENDCTADQSHPLIIDASLKPFGEQLRQFLEKNELSELTIREVPSTAPLTRAQFERASLLWPVNFHEDKYISKCLNGTLFAADQLERIFRLMNETLSLASRSTSNGAGDKACHSMAAIITKNNGLFKVTSAVSEMATSPLNHSVIVAIDNVASIHRKAKSREVESDDLSHYDDDYLCTNYECFLSQDPCIMCAMALVHSRIKRVFIYNAGEQCFEECNDQAYQTHKLHILPNLNHHYEVWKLSTSPVETSPTEQSVNDFPHKRAKCGGDLNK